MAKHNKKENKKTTPAEEDFLLPQNIVGMGERVEEDKSIYIAQDVYNEIHRFAKEKTQNESGGVLLGNIVDEFGKQNIIIRGFIEAKYSEGTPTTLTFTHESWEYIHKEIEKRFPRYKIIGWIHTHPNFGIFLSEYDKFIQQNFFNDENQVAYVVDPIQNEEGFFFWINRKIEKCKGFFLFDKVGTEISVVDETEEHNPPKVVESSRAYSPLLYGMLAIALSLVIVTFWQNSKINTLTKRVESLFEKNQKQQETIWAEQEHGLYLQNQISALSQETQSLRIFLSLFQEKVNELETELGSILSLIDEVAGESVSESQDVESTISSDAQGDDSCSESEDAEDSSVVFSEESEYSMGD